MCPRLIGAVRAEGMHPMASAAPRLAGRGMRELTQVEEGYSGVAGAHRGIMQGAARPAVRALDGRKEGLRAGQGQLAAVRGRH